MANSITNLHEKHRNAKILYTYSKFSIKKTISYSYIHSKIAANLEKHPLFTKNLFDLTLVMTK